MSELQEQLVDVAETDLKSERVEEEGVQPTENRELHREQVQSAVLVTEIMLASRQSAAGLAPREQIAVTIHGRRRFRSGPNSEVVEFAVKLG